MSNKLEQGGENDEDPGSKIVSKHQYLTKRYGIQSELYSAGPEIK